MSTPRIRKVNELLREVIAEKVTQLKDPGIGFVTITGVETSPDLRNATVYYTVLGTDEEQAATAEALERATPKLQASLGTQVRMRYTPRLLFLRDPAIESGLKIEQRLRELRHD